MGRRRQRRDSVNSSELLISILYLRLRRERASIVPTHLAVSALWAEDAARDGSACRGCVVLFRAGPYWPIGLGLFGHRAVVKHYTMHLRTAC